MQKIKITIALLLISIVFHSYGSNNPQDKFDYDKFKAEKIAFYTNSLELTPDEAAVFWPVYNEYEKKQRELFQEPRIMDEKFVKGIDKMTEKECIEFTRKYSSFQQKEVDIDKEYNEKFLKVLPARKVVKLYVTEINFREHLLRKYRDFGHFNNDNN
jgi:hypothetical protein